MLRTRILALLAAAAIGARPVPAQSVADHPRVRQALALLQTWLEAQRAYDQVPGVSGAVVHDQQVLWKGGYGYSDLAQRAPATESTIYSICSISKLFTSVAVMQQRDAGHLRLDDPVGKHLPWFDIRRSNPESGDVTIEGLLTHASGLPRESDHPYWTGPEFPFPTREQVIAGLHNQTTLYPAETYYQYSNLGLTLAGEVVSAASRMPYPQYVRARILDPLGLASTTPEMPEYERGKRLATGYSILTRDGTRKPLAFFQARGIAPAAGYASTAEDLARFASWQFRALRDPRDPVLGANTLREMHRVHWTESDFSVTYGLGFMVWRDADKTFVGHGGTCPGYRTQLLLRPEEKLATVFLANAIGVNAEVWAQRMYDIVAPAVRAAVRDTLRRVDADAAIMDRYVGTYETTFSGEIAVVRWEDGIAMLSLPTMDPLRGLTRLKKTGEHTFRRIRRDDALGEEVRFVMGPDGRPTHYVVHNNVYRRRG